MSEVAPQQRSTESALAPGGLDDRSARLLVESSLDVLCRLALDGTFRYVSPACRELLGFEPEEMVGRHLIDFAHPADRALHRRRIEQLMTDGRVPAERRRQLRKDGSWVWLEVWARLIDTDDGEREIFASMRDVSVGHAADEELRVREESNRLLIESVSDYAIYMLDPAGNVASWNPGAQRIKGYTAAEVLGQHFSIFYTPEDVASGHPQEELRRAEADGRYEESGPRVRKDGTTFTANVTITPIRTSDGTLRGFAKVTHDDTARSLAEAALRDSEERFRQVIETIDEGFVLRSVDPLEVIYASPSVERVLGISVDDVYREPMFILPLIHPDDRDRLLGSLVSAGDQADFMVRDGQGDLQAVEIPTGAIELRVVRPDGEQRWIRLRHAPVRAEDGTLTRFATAIEDVTDEVAVRDELTESQAALRAFVDNIPASIILTDRDDNVLIANAAACEFCEVSPADAVGRPWSEMRPTRFSALVDDASADSAGQDRHVELDYIDADGQSRSTILVRFPIIVEAATVGYGRVGFDVTELKRAEVSMRASERRFRSVFETSTDGILLTTLEGDVLAANGALCAMLGRSEAEIVAGGRKLIVDLRDGRLAPALERRELDGHMRTGLTLLRADGTRLPVDVTSSVFEDADGERKTSIIVRDMSEANARELALHAARADAESANAAKSQFLSRMSHELRTPLNSVLGFGQLLGDQPLDERQSRYVKRMMSAGRHLLALIDEVLDITRLESGNLALSPEVTGLGPAVAEAVALVEPLAGARAIEVANEIDPERRLPVLADVQRLKQVLLNVLSNAIKYNRDAGSVTVGLDDPDPRRVRVSVTDTGPGIPADRAEAVFTPFDRLGAEETGVPGTGLGLALSKSLMEAMGGTIGFEAAPGGGTTFWIELRRAETTASTPVQAPFTGSVASALDALAGRTVLLIEDNEANYELVAEALSSAVTLLTAMQGQVGLELAHAHRPDLVLLDLHLPDLNGERVLASLKAHPQTNQIPVIIVSADAGPSRRARLLAAGAAAYLPKPLDLHALVAVSASAIDQAANGRGEGEPW